MLLKAVIQENFGGRNQIQSCPSPLPTKSVYPTKFNPILENLDHVQLFLFIIYLFILAAGSLLWHAGSRAWAQ